MVPRMPTRPALQFSGLSHGTYSRWCTAAEPKSHRIGSPSRGRSAKRQSLSRSHSPILVEVM